MRTEGEQHSLTQIVGGAMNDLVRQFIGVEHLSPLGQRLLGFTASQKQAQALIEGLVFCDEVWGELLNATHAQHRTQEPLQGGCQGEVLNV